MSRGWVIQLSSYLPVYLYLSKGTEIYHLRYYGKKNASHAIAVSALQYTPTS